MARTTTAGGAAAAALVVALGMASPAAAAPWSPPLHGGESPSAEPSVAGDHADHVAGMDHGDHGEHGTESAAPEDHGDHDSETATPEDHGDHDSGTATPEGGHGGEADTVSDQTRVSVLGGFGAVNAAVIGSAFLLRRRDRRTGRQPRTNPGSHR